MTVFGNDFNTRDGSCVRDYVHVSDIADAHVKALSYLMKEESDNRFEVFNLGTGRGVTVIEAIKAFEDNVNIKLNYKIGERREGDVGAIYSDCKKVKRTLNWEAKYNINDMMISAWKWQKRINEESI